VTAPIPSTPTWPDLTLTAQTSQFGVDPKESVLWSLAAPSTRALQAEINVAASLKNKAYVRP